MADNDRFEVIIRLEDGSQFTILTKPGQLLFDMRNAQGLRGRPAGVTYVRAGSAGAGNVVVIGDPNAPVAVPRG